MVTGKQVNVVRLSNNYEEISNIPVNMKNQREARPEQSEMTSDHIQECLALSELQAAHPVEKNKKSLDQMESHTKC